MKLYGLIGYPLAHSFSQQYFTDKFAAEGIPAAYTLFPIEHISLFPRVLQENPALCGLNVTIPYKEQIIPFLDELDATAQETGAVNVIKFTQNGALKGYNTDITGFEASLRKLPAHTHALILGTGGAAKGVAYVLKKMNIRYLFVSRTPKEGQIAYSDIHAARDYTLIINATPVGTFPNTNACPDFPYKSLTSKHLLYDLIYNPEKTLFLRRGEAQGASIKNGLEMLHGQALAAWDIWKK